MEPKQEKFPQPEKDEIELNTFIKEFIAIINGRFGKLENKISELETGISSFKKLENDISDIKTDVSSLRGSNKLTVNRAMLKDLKE